jgi:hypothetical protein
MPSRCKPRRQSGKQSAHGATGPVRAFPLLLRLSSKGRSPRLRPCPTVPSRDRCSARRRRLPPSVRCPRADREWAPGSDNGADAARRSRRTRGLVRH